MAESLIGIVILLMVVGVALWAINTYVPMDPKIKQILNITVALVMVLIVLMFFLSLFGLGARWPASIR